ncbi:MAG: hypothetical protein R6W76_23275 [Caldilinea sp.]
MATTARWGLGVAWRSVIVGAALLWILNENYIGAGSAVVTAPGATHYDRI